MSSRRRWMQKLNNSGAALVTVIVVIAFISVMVTIMLYVSGLNYQMKATDKETKDSFYEAETALENIRGALMVKVKDAYQVAAEEVMVEFTNLNPTQREDLYKQVFEEELWNDFVKEDGTALINLQDFLQAESGYGANVTTSSILPVNGTLADGIIVIEDVCISFTKDGYYTQVTTDLQVQPPAVSWSIDTSVEDWDTGTDTVSVQNALKRDVHTMADSVIYVNWKKE